MSELTFFGFGADMGDADFFGFLQRFFPGNLLIQSAQPSEIVLRDSAIGTTIDISGSFATGSVATAQVNAWRVLGPSSEPLVSWSGDAISLGALVGLNSAQFLALSMRGSDVIHGSVLSDRLFGFSGDDQLLGSTGDDLLDGGAGADRMVGGGGNNTYVVDNVHDVVVEDPAIVQGPDLHMHRVSVSAAGAQANFGSTSPSVSADGRFVAFVSEATNLGPQDDNFVADLYVKDMLTGAVQRFAVPVDVFAFRAAHPSISVDGRFVAFEGGNDIYLADLKTGQLQVVSQEVPGTSTSFIAARSAPAVSGDGAQVAFTANGFTPSAGDQDTLADVVVRDVNHPVVRAALTPGTLLVAHASDALVSEYSPAGDFVQRFDLRNATTGLETLHDVAVDAAGQVFAYVRSPQTALNSLDPGTGATSTRTVPGWDTVDSLTSGGVAALDGFVFVTDMQLAGDAPGQRGLIRIDPVHGTAERVGAQDFTDVTAGLDGLVYALGAGTIAVFDPATLAPVRTVNLTGFDALNANGLAVDGSGTIYLLGAFGQKLLALDAAGSVLRTTPLPGGAISVDVRADGEIAVLGSSGTLTVMHADFTGQTSFYVGDSATAVAFYAQPDPAHPLVPQTGWHEASNAVSIEPAAGASGHAAISADGRLVAFDSAASNLVAGDVNGVVDVFVKDLQTGTVRRIDVASDGTAADNDSRLPDISADGRYAVFESRASNLVPGVANTHFQIYWKDLQTGEVRLASVDVAGHVAAVDCVHASVSDDGRFVAFESGLTAFGANSFSDASAFLKDMLSGEVVDLGVPPPGLLVRPGGHDPVVSGDGHFIVFSSAGNSLVDADSNRAEDIFEAANPFLSTDPRNVDTIRSTVSYALPTGVEKLQLLGSDNLSGTGNELDNVLIGNGGANLLDGGAGRDTMAGAGGDDSYVVDDSGDMIQEAPGAGIDRVLAHVDFAMPDNVEQLRLSGAQAHRAIGNDGGNVIADDTGQGELDGGGGDDVYEAGAGTVIHEAADAGIDTVRARADYALPANVEVLELTGAAIEGTGNDGANRLLGTAAANHLDGLRGADEMAGGAGDDVYVVDQSLDSIVEAPGQGFDRVLAAVSHTLSANVEALTLDGAAGNIDGTGNALDNALTGNGAANVLDGGAGNDALDGRGGDDVLIGGAGDDRLTGGAGQDVLLGGSGADHFVFDAQPGAARDRIADFVHGEDAIDLSQTAFGGLGAAGHTLTAGQLVSSAGAHAIGTQAQVIHDAGTGVLYYDPDGTGAQAMHAFAEVTPGQTVTASDFHVV